MFYLEKSYLNIALPGQEHFARTMSPNAMSNMADSGVVTIAICHFWLQHDIPVKSVTWMWQEWSGELLRQMLYEMDCKMFFFFKRLLHSWCVSLMHAKVGSHLAIFDFRVPLLFVAYRLSISCMHCIHNMHDHAYSLSVRIHVAELVCITFMKHAYIINIRHGNRGNIWLRLVLWYGSFWAGVTFGHCLGQHRWGQGKSPEACHRPGFQQQENQTE